MSDEWIQYIASQKLTSPENIKIGEMLIDNPHLITKYVAAVDKGSGTTYFLKIVDETL